MPTSPQSAPRILCAVDFSGSADAAVDHAARLARRLGAELHLVHAPPLPIAAFPEAGLTTVPVHPEQVIDEARAGLESYAAHHPGIDVALHVRLGPPCDVVLELQQELGADYLVLGTHGRTGLDHLLMGSVAEQVVRRAPVPVLTVRPDCDAPRLPAASAGPPPREATS